MIWSLSNEQGICPHWRGWVDPPCGSIHDQDRSQRHNLLPNQKIITMILLAVVICIHFSIYPSICRLFAVRHLRSSEYIGSKLKRPQKITNITYKNLKINLKTSPAKVTQNNPQTLLSSETTKKWCFE